MIAASVRLSVVSVFIASISLVCQLIVAHTFGASHQYDVYLFAISIPFLVMGAAAGAVSQAFVPRLMEAQQHGETYRGSVSALLAFALTAAIVVAFGGMQITIWSAAAIKNTILGADHNAVFQIARVAWVTAGLSIFVSALTAVHHTEKSFVLPAITTGIPYVGMILALTTLSSQDGAIILAWGMLGAYVTIILILLPKSARNLSRKWLPQGQFKALFDGAGRVVLVIVANCAFTGMAPVEAFLAPRFGNGALSSLGYSQRLIIAMGSVLVAGPSVLLVPAIAEARIGNSENRVKQLAGKSIGTICVIATLAAMLFGVLRVPVIHIALQHGAFNAHATAAVAATLPWMLVGSVAMLGAQIAFRALYGQNLHLFPAIIGILVPICYFLTGLLFSHVIGFQGICMAYAFSWWLVFSAMLIKLFGANLLHLRFIVHVRTLAILGALAGSAAAARISEVLLLPVIDKGNSLISILACFGITILGLCVFLLIASTAWPVLSILHIRSAPERQVAPE